MSFIARRLSNFYRSFTHAPPEQAKFIVLGLDASGKTTVLYKLLPYASTMFHRADVITHIPTIGFNVETLDMREINLTCWDVGGCDKIRPLWRHYTEGATGVMFFIDVNDRDRIENAKTELDIFLEDPTLLNAPLLVVANKYDLPNAKPLQEVISELGLENIKDRYWSIIKVCASAGEGIPEIIAWLEAETTKSKRNGGARPVPEPMSVASVARTTGSMSIADAPTGDVDSTPATGASGNSSSASDNENVVISAKIAEAKVASEAQTAAMVAENWVQRVDSSEEEFLQQLLLKTMV